MEKLPKDYEYFSYFLLGKLRMFYSSRIDPGTISHSFYKDLLFFTELSSYMIGSAAKRNISFLPSESSLSNGGGRYTKTKLTKYILAV